MGRACSKHGKEEECILGFAENYTKDLDTEGRKTLKPKIEKG
jgi:hypothetical protein